MTVRTLKAAATDPVLYLATLMAVILFGCLPLTLRYEAEHPADALAMVAPAGSHLLHTAPLTIDD